jgi:hypothetical protein
MTFLRHYILYGIKSRISAVDLIWSVQEFLAKGLRRFTGELVGNTKFLMRRSKKYYRDSWRRPMVPQRGL